MTWRKKLCDDLADRSQGEGILEAMVFSEESQRKRVIGAGIMLMYPGGDNDAARMSLKPWRENGPGMGQHARIGERRAPDFGGACPRQGSVSLL
jgi:hypothetical protein